ncbi:MAG: ROK family protein [Kiritimatiellia bacterium]
MNDHTSRTAIVRHIIRHGRTAKAAVEEALGLSHPTVTNTVAALIRAGVLREEGEYESTGGRRAKVIAANPAYRHFGGLDLTRNHIAMVIVDFAGNTVARRRCRLSYADTPAYYRKVCAAFARFGGGWNLDAVGVSLPGILSMDRRTLVKSHALGIENLDLTPLSLGLATATVEYENDANAAAQAELAGFAGDTSYLSLSNTVGGAIFQNGALRLGDNRRAGEFGHVTLHPAGAACYCGRRGCADTYLSALRLSGQTGSLEDFFVRLAGGDEGLRGRWSKYLDDLSLLISNLRLAYDCNVMLGGYVGAFLEPYRDEISERLWRMNLFDRNLDFVRFARCGLEASAIGAALHLRDRTVAGL